MDDIIFEEEFTEEDRQLLELYNIIKGLYPHYLYNFLVEAELIDSSYTSKIDRKMKKRTMNEARKLIAIHRSMDNGLEFLGRKPFILIRVTEGEA